MQRRTCYKFEKHIRNHKKGGKSYAHKVTEQHIHADASAHVTGRYLRYFLRTRHYIYQVHEKHDTVGDYGDVIYKKETHIDFQWGLLKADVHNFIESIRILQPERGAIAWDAGHVQVSTTSPESFNFTCTGSNGLLIQSVTDAAAITDFITAHTYNGVSTTLLTTVAPPVRLLYYYYMLNPPTGSNSLSISFTAGNYLMSAASWTGVAQTGFPDSQHTAQTSSASSITDSTTVVLPNCWTVACTECTGAYSAGTGTTDRTSPGSESGIVDSNGTVGTGPQSLQITDGAGQTFGMIITSIAPFIASTGYTSTVNSVKSPSKINSTTPVKINGI